MAETSHTAKRRRLTSNIVKIKTGDSAETLNIHEEILRASSPFFRAALNQKWAEGAALEITFPEDEFEHVSAYAHWLYDDETIIAGGCSPRTAPLAKQYVFGEKIQDDAFCDHVLSEMTRYADRMRAGADGKRYGPTARSVEIIYLGTHAGAPVRDFLVQLWVDRDRRQEVDDFPKEFLIDVIRSLMVQRGTDLALKPFFVRRRKWFKKAEGGGKLASSSSGGERPRC